MSKPQPKTPVGSILQIEPKPFLVNREIYGLWNIFLKKVIVQSWTIEPTLFNRGRLN